MAAVFMPEDPSGQVREAYNNASWKKQAITTIAGPAANLIFLAAILAALATVPLPIPTYPLISIDDVAPNTPAAQEGIKPGDYIIQVNNILIPTKKELTDTISSAMLTGDSINLQVKRQKENLAFRVTPIASVGLIGLTISEYTPPSPNRPINPEAVTKRFANLTSLYFNATASLVASIGDSSNTSPVLSSPVMSAYYTAQAVQHAHLRAWLAILAVFTLGTAFLNLLPIPPLDGYNLLLQTISRIRNNRPINPTFERALTISGISFIVTATIYLIMSDIIQLLE